MYLDWRTRFLFLGFITVLYFMVSCLVNVTKMDAKRQTVHTEYLMRRHGPSSFAGILNESELRKRKQNLKITWCSPLGLKAVPGPMVALASFPGSGNTWLRYLLQQSSGILTGSIYRDFALLKNGFPAENVANGSVLAVKTHEFGPTARQDFEKAVLLVRDPFSSVLAEFNRRSGGHIGHASRDKFRKENGKFWREFVLSKGAAWEQMNLDWANNFQGSKLVVFYRDLIDDTETELRRILNFLNISISEKMLRCTMDLKEGIYRRAKRPDTTENLFDRHLTQFLKSKQKKVFQLLTGLRQREASADNL